MAVLSLKNICYSYGTTPVLQDVSYDFEKGKMYCIIGKSGRAKQRSCLFCPGLRTPIKARSITKKSIFRTAETLEK